MINITEQRLIEASEAMKRLTDAMAAVGELCYQLSRDESIYPLKTQAKTGTNKSDRKRNRKNRWR